MNEQTVSTRSPFPNSKKVYVEGKITSDQCSYAGNYNLSPDQIDQRQNRNQSGQLQFTILLDLTPMKIRN